MQGHSCMSMYAGGRFLCSLSSEDVSLGLGNHHERYKVVTFLRKLKVLESESMGLQRLQP